MPLVRAAPVQTIVCMKWGTRYPADFVNRLASMIDRHTGRPTRLICYTDDPTGIRDEVLLQPLPPIELPEASRWTGWQKLSVWQSGLADLEGDVLFFDLDMVVTGSLDPFFDHAPGEFCVIENFTQRGQGEGNTSIFRWPVGRYARIYDKLQADPEGITSQYRIEQQYISAEIPEQVFWPRDWCVSFKHDLIPSWPLNFVRTPPLPATVRAVAFTGKPDPDEAAVGHWPVKASWKRLYKHVRPTPWITENWR